MKPSIPLTLQRLCELHTLYRNSEVMDIRSGLTIGGEYNQVYEYNIVVVEPNFTIEYKFLSIPNATDKYPSVVLNDETLLGCNLIEVEVKTRPRRDADQAGDDLTIWLLTYA